MPRDGLDQESTKWVGDLGADSPARDAAAARLHALLLRVTRAESARRKATMPARGHDELDDLCVQAANDALLGILRKLPEFRGDARFTTWACKFAIFEISTRLRRHAWRQRRLTTDESIWETLPDSAPPALAVLQGRETLARLQRAVREELTDRQRRVFQAVVLEEVPIDVLAERMNSTRGALYKILHDARTRLRRALERGERQEERP
ncbi:MAG TPA: sigma-70 family RNA polymerase sigma factor [Gemmatimonadales bacterium]|jgi:RNA polymerase sigma-70 factor (ECF subfamily)